MIKLNVTTKDDIIEQCTVYDCYDIPINDIIRCVKVVKKRNDYYLNIPCAFDIETSSINCDKPYGFMYQWQFCIGQSVCFGRTWEEFQILINRLHRAIQYQPTLKYVCYVHNLPYEFQFMYQFLTITSIFARKKRKPMIVRTCEQIEFRDSYVLSNMSLEKFCKNSKLCKFYKKEGDKFNYAKLRTPKTKLTQYEMEYCYCDVRGLCECIYTLMLDDNLATIPLTSTGYVRRDFKEFVRTPEHDRFFKKIALNERQYTLAKKAYRGGDVSSNTLYVDELLYDIYSFDLKSSYPASLLIDKYPMSKFVKVTINSQEKFDRLINTKACLFTVVCDNLHVKSMKVIPYIARHKCNYIEKGRYGNGRVLSAKRIEFTITDIDWKIIRDEYDIDKFVITEMYVAEYGYLPERFRQKLFDMFKQKCELQIQLEKLEKSGLKHSQDYKDIKYIYDKFKNKINAVYGMCVTDIVSPDIIFDGVDWDEEDIDINSKLYSYYNFGSNFLSYQHGVWCTAHARLRLRKMMHIVGRDVIYIDTDCIKFKNAIHCEEFARANKEHYEIVKNLGYIVNIENEEFVIGSWEFEHKYEEFKTLGSKKYLLKEDGVYYLTLAGVNKENGSEFFNKKGIKAFKKNTKIPYKYSKRMSAYYNYEQIHKITVNGDTFTTASNTALLESTYILGITDEYQELINILKSY